MKISRVSNSFRRVRGPFQVRGGSGVVVKVEVKTFRKKTFRVKGVGNLIQKKVHVET